jgi:hypothetical protein
LIGNSKSDDLCFVLKCWLQSQILQADSTLIRYANNIVTTSGTINASFSGTNTNTYFDKSNILNGDVPSNAGTGAIIEVLGSTTPSGTFAVGDRVEQRVPVVGQPKGWRLTAAPGTWTSEGNL